MKTEELTALKEEAAALNNKPADPSEDELSQVSGGVNSTDGRIKPPHVELDFLYNAEDSGHKPSPLYSELPHIDYTKYQ